MSPVVKLRFEKNINFVTHSCGISFHAHFIDYNETRNILEIYIYQDRIIGLSMLDYVCLEIMRNITK